MPYHPEFLLVDDNPDDRFLLAKSLLRKFPGAYLQECEESEAATIVTRRPSLTAVVVHRVSDMNGLWLIQALRRANAILPILYVSGVDRREAAFDAGATGFLNYDAWLNIGAAMEDMLRTRNTPNPFVARDVGHVESFRATTDPFGMGAVTLRRR